MYTHIYISGNDYVSECNEVTYGRQIRHAAAGSPQFFHREVLMTIEEMKAAKKELGYSNQYLAAISGVPLGTVQKIFSGATGSPRRKTLEALEKALSRGRRRLVKVDTGSEGTFRYSDSLPAAPTVHEPTAAYGRGERIYTEKGGYTLEDYLALPDDMRVELIDGIFYDMAAPTTIHQAIAGFLYKLLLDHVLAGGGPCMPFMSPVDVQLDADDSTVVQPDVLIICNRDLLQNGRIFGAPDFLAEILSPSTRKKDMQTKLYKYGRAGVREYWMIDPDRKRVIVYDLEHEEVPAVYTFDDSVPVGIWDGACRIDFAAIYSHISFLYES